jgi:hypothetical protein
MKLLRLSAAALNQTPLDWEWEEVREKNCASNVSD